MVSKKDKIVQTALELFTEQGYRATTTKEIAVKSGVAEGLIFYYFKDKNELLNYLISKFSFVESIDSEMKELAEMEPVPALIQLGHLYSNFLSRNKGYLSFIWSPEMVQNKEVNGKVIDLIFSLSKQINKHLKRAVSSRVDETTIELATTMFLSTLLTHFMIGERAADETPFEDEYIENVVNFILKGLAISN
ncbi:TetR/AcrR family transcriptional regulator [Sporosarcina sp. Te-1]|uniref:TetR/AcrR family transcriptional regulator n=1 Tax=Sporosarcina sp. Te-1 TaxID=2818390 RepID=UPI001AA005BB|nr:TetR/AcrR family transcriptional regulator [Sporosarcina sp. Te-1]QTD39507.1 TetR/AcrR family transcriptional regulator [Sporosarcina sp. Te-1]